MFFLSPIQAASNGVPRDVNLVCDRTLQLAFERCSPVIDEELVKEACSEAAAAPEVAPPTALREHVTFTPPEDDVPLQLASERDRLQVPAALRDEGASREISRPGPRPSEPSPAPVQAFGDLPPKQLPRSKPALAGVDVLPSPLAEEPRRPAVVRPGRRRGRVSILIASTALLSVALLFTVLSAVALWQAERWPAPVRGFLVEARHSLSIAAAEWSRFEAKPAEPSAPQQALAAGEGPASTPEGAGSAALLAEADPVEAASAAAPEAASATRTAVAPAASAVKLSALPAARPKASKAPATERPLKKPVAKAAAPLRPAPAKKRTVSRPPAPKPAKHASSSPAKRAVLADSKPSKDLRPLSTGLSLAPGSGLSSLRDRSWEALARQRGGGRLAGVPQAKSKTKSRTESEADEKR